MTAVPELRAPSLRLLSVARVGDHHRWVEHLLFRSNYLALYAVRHCKVMAFAAIYSLLPSPGWNFRQAGGKVRA